MKVHDTLHGSSGEDSTYGYDALGDLTSVDLPVTPSNPTAQYTYAHQR